MAAVSMEEVRAAAAPAAPAGMITQATVDRYLMDIRPGIKPTTYKAYQTCMRVFDDWLQDQGTTQPTATDLLNYKLHLEEDGIAAGTRRQYIRLVKAFFEWTAAAGLYPDIALHVQGVKMQTNIYHRDALKPEDVQKIAASIDTSTTAGKRLYAVFLLCVSCGLRMIEVSRARMQDKREEHGRWYLYVQGKGHDEPDTAVLLPDEVVAAIDDYLQDVDPLYKLPKSPLFSSTSNRSKGQRIAATTLSTQLKAAFVAAGYDSSRITAHSLRHTSGTAVYKATHNIYLAQQHQRHKDPKTTEIYVHADDRETRTTEDIAFDYLMNKPGNLDPREEAVKLIEQMPADKLATALQILKAL